MSSKSRILSIYRQKAPGRLLKKQFERVTKTKQRNGVEKINAYYHLTPNLGIFESYDFLAFNKARYSTRSRVDQLVESMFEQPARGSKMSNDAVRRHAFTSFEAGEGRQRKYTRMLKREVAMNTFFSRNLAGKPEDLVDITAQVHPADRPELRKHMSWYTPRSTYDTQVYNFFKKIKHASH